MVGVNDNEWDFDAYRLRRALTIPQAVECQDSDIELGFDRQDPPTFRFTNNPLPV